MGDRDEAVLKAEFRYLRSSISESRDSPHYGETGRPAVNEKQSETNRLTRARAVTSDSRDNGIEIRDGTIRNEYLATVQKIAILD
jgi:hypothetical protein